MIIKGRQDMDIDKSPASRPAAQRDRMLPTEQAMDVALLSGIKPYLMSHFPAFRQLTVLRNGCIVYDAKNEKPFERAISKIMKAACLGTAKLARKPALTFVDEIGDMHNLRSVTKSIVSLLVGIAMDKGLIKSVKDKVCDYLLLDIGKDHGKGNITIEHLLKMTAGFPSIEKPGRALKLSLSGGDWVSHIWRMKLESVPGVRFEYNSANVHLLSAILTKVSGMSTLSFAQKYLLNPLGISDVRWDTDGKGICFGGGNLFMSLYDLAKIGCLCLGNGRWNEQTLVSEEWLEKSYTPYCEWMYGFHYGYLWYIKDEVSESSGRKYVTFSASGAGGQKLIMIPQLGIVAAAVSRTDLLSDKSYFLNNLIGRFLLPAADG